MGCVQPTTTLNNKQHTISDGISTTTPNNLSTGAMPTSITSNISALCSSQYLQFLFQQMVLNPLPSHMIDIQICSYIKNLLEKYYWAEQKKGMLIQILEQFLQLSVDSFGDFRSNIRKKFIILSQVNRLGQLLGQAVSKLSNQAKVKNQWLLESLSFQEEAKRLTFDLKDQTEAHQFSVKVMRQADKQLQSIFYLSCYFMKCCQKMEKDGASPKQIIEALGKKVTKIKDDFSVKGAKMAEQKYLFKKNKEQQKISEGQFKNFKKEYQVLKLKLPGDISQKQRQLERNIEWIIEKANKNHEAFDNVFKASCINNNGFGYKSNLKLYNMSNKMGLVRVKQKLLERFIKDQFEKQKGNMKHCQTISDQIRVQQDLFNQILLKIYSKLEEVEFSVTDMLRGKCMFNKVSQINNAITEVMKQVQQQKQNGLDMQIVQLVNRLQGEKVVTKDIMLKIRIQSLVCQFQMALSFSTAQNEIHHKMYELIRAKTFSPLFMLSQWNKKAIKEYFSALNKCLKFQIDQKYKREVDGLKNFIGYQDDEKSMNEEELKYIKKTFSRDIKSQGNWMDQENNIKKIGNTIDFWFEVHQYEKAKKVFQSLKQNDKNETNDKINERMIKIVQKIGSVNKNLGKYEDALSFYTRSLKIKQTVKEKDSIDCAITMNNIGQVYFKLGKYQDALGYYNRCLKIKQMVKGKDSIECSTTLNNIGEVYNNLGKYEDSLSYYSRCLQIKQTLKGKDSIDCGATLNNIGLVHFNLGKYEDALSYYNRSLKIKQSAKGKDSIDCAITLNNIGEVYKNLGKYEDSLSYYTRCLKIKQAIKGKDSIDCATTLHNIGQVYNNLGKYEDCMSYYSRCLNIKQTVKGKDSIDCATTLNNIGLVHFSAGKYEEALGYYSRCLKIKQTVKGKDSIDCATTLNNIGLAHFNLGKYEDCLSQYSRCLKIKQTIKGKNSIDCATTLNNIGLVYYKLSNYEDCLIYYNRCLKIQQTIKGKNSVDCATTLNNIGLVYFNLGKYEDALNYYIQALEITKNIFGEYSPRTLNIYQLVLYCYQKLGHSDKCKQLNETMRLVKKQ